MEANCLFRGTRVIIPTCLRPQVLAELHASHPGIVRMKGLAQSQVWWPGMDKSIEAEVGKCMDCQQQRNQPAPVPLHQWCWSRQPWERLDFAGPVDGAMLLVVVGSHSKWLEVISMSTTTANKTIDVLRSLFARYWLPQDVVTDNGPQFTSAEFAEFMCENGICDFSAPYHPATNGAAERCVQTLKNALRA